MKRTSLLWLFGGFAIGLAIAIAIIPSFTPQGSAKPFGFFNNWGGMGGGMMPYGNTGQVPPNGSNNGGYNQNYWGQMMGPGMMNPQTGSTNGYPTNFSSNGQRIYFTASSKSGKPISARMMGMKMVNMQMSCAYCHGTQGQGQTISMPMGTWQTPKIAYKYLVSENHGHNNETEEDHAKYTEESIKRAITEGIDPDGDELQWPMPSWNMAEEDLNDLVNYLKELPE